MLPPKTRGSIIRYFISDYLILSTFLAVIVFAGFVLAPGGIYKPVAHAQDNMVLVRLKNTTSDAAIRCVIHLAHWFSHDLGRLEPNRETEFFVRVDSETRLVTLKNDAGVDMAVEGIRCSVANSPEQFVDWISADAIRDSARRVEITCSTFDAFRCKATMPNP